MSEESICMQRDFPMSWGCGVWRESVSVIEGKRGEKKEVFLL